MSMTRLATGSHLWQMRWQYTFNQARVWRTWEQHGVPGAARATGHGRTPARPLYHHAATGRAPLAPRNVAMAIRAYGDFLRLDFQKTSMSLDDYRNRLTGETADA